MILTVTLNAALDVTYRVPRLVPPSVMRVDHVHQQAGGKGVNVARVLASAGVPACATGLAGGIRGAAIRDGLAAAGVRDEFEEIAGDSRQTVVVIDRDGRLSEFDEPGPEVRSAEWARFQKRYARVVQDARVVVLSGSLPPGIPADAYAILAAVARAAAAEVIVDAGGPPLRLACAASPQIVKPNERELHDAAEPGNAAAVVARPAGSAGPVPATAHAVAHSAGSAGPTRASAAQAAAWSAGPPTPFGQAARAGPPTVAAALAAAEDVRSLGAGAVVASLGAAGLVAVTPDGRWSVSHPVLRGNPVGAGDALVAGLAMSRVKEATWPQTLVTATSLAMASVSSPWAGEVDPAEAAALAATVRVRRL